MVTLNNFVVQLEPLISLLPENQNRFSSQIIQCTYDKQYSTLSKAGVALSIISRKLRRIGVKENTPLLISIHRKIQELSSQVVPPRATTSCDMVTHRSKRVYIQQDKRNASLPFKKQKITTQKLETWFVNLPEYSIKEIISYLCPQKIGRLARTCRLFYKCCSELQLEHSQALCKMEKSTHLLSEGCGVAFPADPLTAKNAWTFLLTTRQCIKKLNQGLPKGIKLTRRVAGSKEILQLVPCDTQNFLQKLYDYSRQCLPLQLWHNICTEPLDKTSSSIIELDLNCRNGGHLLYFPRELCYTVSLQRLSLFDAKFFSLPKEIGQFKKLLNFSLIAGNLTELPPEIGQLESLQNFLLNNNHLSKLPPEIGQLTSLQTLSLDYNQLKTLPREIGKLKSLQILYLGNNPLTELPPEIGQLSSLTVLGLDTNVALQHSSLIEELKKRGCKVELSIPSSFFKKPIQE